MPMSAQDQGVGKALQDLKSPDETIRKQAAESLFRTGTLDPVKDLPALLKALSDSSADVRFYAAGFLSKVAYTEEKSSAVLQTAAGPLAEHLADPDPRVRESLALTFAVLQPSVPQSAVPALLARLRDPVWKVNAHALTALGRVRPVLPPMVDAVADELKKDQSSTIRGTAARALGTMGDTRREVIDALTAALRDKESFVRQEAVRALANLGPAASPALGELERLRKNPASDPALRQNVKSAILRIKGQP
jgi:HEAT repeat protein